MYPYEALPVAAPLSTVLVKLPLGAAVEVSLEKSIRSIDDTRLGVSPPQIYP